MIISLVHLLPFSDRAQFFGFLENGCLGCEAVLKSISESKLMSHLYFCLSKDSNWNSKIKLLNCLSHYTVTLYGTMVLVLSQEIQIPKTSLVPGCEGASIANSRAACSNIRHFYRWVHKPLSQYHLSTHEKTNFYVPQSWGWLQNLDWCNSWVILMLSWVWEPWQQRDKH